MAFIQKKRRGNSEGSSPDTASTTTRATATTVSAPSGPSTAPEAAPQSAPEAAPRQPMMHAFDNNGPSMVVSKDFAGPSFRKARRMTGNTADDDDDDDDDEELKDGDGRAAAMERGGEEDYFLANYEADASGAEEDDADQLRNQLRNQEAKHGMEDQDEEMRRTGGAHGCGGGGDDGSAATGGGRDGGGLRLSPTASQQRALAVALQEVSSNDSSPSASAVLFPAKMGGFRWSFNSAKSNSASSLSTMTTTSSSGGDGGSGLSNDFSKRPDSTPRILIVEDSKLTLKFETRLFENALARFGFAGAVAIDQAPNGAEACRRVKAMSDRGSSYAMIVMDLSMPVLDGLAATEYVRQHMYHGSTIPIVALSSFDKLQPPLADKSLQEFLFSQLVKKPLTKAAAEGLISRFVTHILTTSTAELCFVDTHVSTANDEAPVSSDGGGGGDRRDGNDDDDDDDDNDENSDGRDDLLGKKRGGGGGGSGGNGGSSGGSSSSSGGSSGGGSSGGEGTAWSSSSSNAAGSSSSSSTGGGGSGGGDDVASGASYAQSSSSEASAAMVDDSEDPAKQQRVVVSGKRGGQPWLLPSSSSGYFASMEELADLSGWSDGHDSSSSSSSSSSAPSPYSMVSSPSLSSSSDKLPSWALSPPQSPHGSPCHVSSPCSLDSFDGSSSSSACPPSSFSFARLTRGSLEAQGMRSEPSPTSSSAGGKRKTTVTKPPASSGASSSCSKNRKKADDAPAVGRASVPVAHHHRPSSSSSSSSSSKAWSTRNFKKPAAKPAAKKAPLVYDPYLRYSFLGAVRFGGPPTFMQPLCTASSAASSFSSYSSSASSSSSSSAAASADFAIQLLQAAVPERIQRFTPRDRRIIPAAFDATISSPPMVIVPARAQPIDAVSD